MNDHFPFLVEIDEMEQEAPLQSSNPIGVRTILKTIKMSLSFLVCCSLSS